MDVTIWCTCVYLLFVSEESFSWTGARNWNFRKLGTEEEEWRRARRPPKGLRWIFPFSIENIISAKHKMFIVSKNILYHALGQDHTDLHISSVHVSQFHSFQIVILSMTQDPFAEQRTYKAQWVWGFWKVSQWIIYVFAFSRKNTYTS